MGISQVSQAAARIVKAAACFLPLEAPHILPAAARLAQLSMRTPVLSLDALG
jgi:hypothetical protein